MHAIVAGREHAQRCVEVFALIDPLEGVGKQNDLTTGLWSNRFGRRHEYVAAEGGQGTARADAGEALEQLSQERAAVAQIHQRRKARGEAGIAREIADQPVAQRQAVRGSARGQHLDLHPGHVDAGGALMAAGLAGDAELQRFHHRVGR